jgi:hypothetical protein
VVCCVLTVQVSERMRKQQRELESAAYNQRQVRQCLFCVCVIHMIMRIELHPPSRQLCCGVVLAALYLPAYIICDLHRLLAGEQFVSIVT